MTWNPLESAYLTCYKVYRSYTPGGPYDFIAAPGPKENYHTDADLVYGITYYYAVSAYAAEREGDRSAEVSAINYVVTAVPVVAEVFTRQN